MQGFFDSFSKYIAPDDTLILAISGGVDSMVLLDLALWNHPKEKLIIAHFDHTLRGWESDMDREFVWDFAGKNELLCETKKLDIVSLAENEKASIESTARKYRYKFLIDIAEKYRAKYILTAHHQDDRIETAIFNLIRGTKLWGIHALSKIQNIEEVIDTYIFRPLAHISKKEIREYAVIHKLEYREDSTNSDTRYLRNKLRHHILPEFECINPEYRRAISNFIDYSEELQSWIDDEVRLFLSEGKSFLVSKFSGESPFFQREVIRYLYEQANSGTIGLSEGNIEEIQRYILTASGWTHKQLGNLLITKQRSRIFFSH